jgi:hypothetical protein
MIMHAQQNGSAKKYLLYHNILILNKFKNQTVKDQFEFIILEEGKGCTLIWTGGRRYD